MQTRRQFLQDLAFLAGAAGLNGGLLSSIQQAVAIEPEPGTSFLDAEHVVILMQENRSFDHTFGTLRGVRGFRDPRAIQLANGDPVWVQTNPKGEKYVPFRLNLKETKTTWMGDLPHGWTDQVDAANKGLHDRWLHVKRSGNRAYAEMPLTLGYHTREDIPFYYALADAFTICDQNFCSSLTGTTPNRLHLWTGTCRTEQTPESQAIVRNEDCDFGRWASWTTFPERLEDHGISWKIYQNELSVPTGLSGNAASWLGNFTDSPVEWFTQYNVRLHEKHRELITHSLKSVSGEIEAISKKLPTLSGEERDKQEKRLKSLKETLERLKKEQVEFSADKFEQLSPREKNLHTKAFVTNLKDPFYRELENLVYQDGTETRQLEVPKGDVLYQFREDVKNGELPAVSWLVPAGRFSDHPGHAWFGQWYLSEVLNILTSNPEVWKKTIFILTYDENDGYFDHIPPFQAPHPNRPETGKTSAELGTALDYLEADQDRKYKPKAALRDNSIGLGFRVPMIIASPWSRGGAVCSQIFDHTSVIQFLEKFASHKSGKDVRETNISDWRRTVCGDLTSAFRSSNDPTPGLTEFLERDPHIEQINNARFKELPSGFHALSEEEQKQARANWAKSLLPQQEPGTKPSCPLPYELAVDGELDQSGKKFAIRFSARKEIFGEKASGAPFILYALTSNGLQVRHYAVTAGSQVEETWPLTDFSEGTYHFRVYGPNGFYREFQGSPQGSTAGVQFVPRFAPGSKQTAQCNEIDVIINNQNSKSPLVVLAKDHAYGNAPVKKSVAAGEQQTLKINIAQSSGWYDFGVQSEDGSLLNYRYAGRVETGNWGITDPAISG